jgi:polyisoprenoid-binding protein YceI
MFNYNKIIINTLCSIILIIVPPKYAFGQENSEWNILSEKSKIEFKANQNGSIISGAFKKFSGKITFNQNKLDESFVEIEVDISSINTSLREVVESLKSSVWFSAKLFPKAIFSAEKFTKISESKFKADGSLTIKGKTIPTQLDFSFSEFSDDKAIAVGTAKINRSDFGIGEKEESKANGIKNEVDITFIINAIKQ